MTRGNPGAVARSRVRMSVTLGQALVVTLLSFFALSTTAAAAPSAVAPPGVTNTCSGKDTFYIFRYNDSGTVGIDTGCASKNEVTRAQVPDLVASSLHVSCSDKISPDGVPKKSELGSPDRRITSYYIEKDGGKKSCGFGNPAGPPTVDLAVNKTASATTVESGSEVTYTLQVSNNTTTSASGVTVSDSLPAGVTYVSASPGCTYNAATRKVTCQVGSLGASGPPANTCSGKDTFFRFEYNDSGTVGIDTGCASKKEVTRAQVPDLVATNLHVSCSDKISSDGVPKKSELGSSARRITAYYIEKDGGKKSCGQGTFTPPAPKAFTITAKVSASHCNTATVTSTETDSNPADNTSTVCITVPVPVSQKIKGEIYNCVNGAPSTTLVSGGTVAVPSRGLSSPNPLAATTVPAGTYSMTATAPAGQKFVSCGQSGVNITSPTAASQNVTVPAGGIGDGKFYVEPVPVSQKIKGEIYNCVNGAPSTTLVSGGTVAVPSRGLSSPNPLAATTVPAGTYSMTATAPAGQKFVSCGQSGVNITSPTAASQNVTVPAGGIGDGKFYVETVKYGYVEVCKSSANGVTGSFMFRINGGSNLTVPAGYCSSPVKVESGTATVQELHRDGFTMAGATTTPASRLQSVDTGSRTVKVAVAPGPVSSQTIVNVTNKPVSGTVKVCQVAGTGVSAGTMFSFTNSANGQVAKVPAGPGPGGYCVVLDGTFTGHLTVTQSASPTKVSAIDVEPAARALSKDLAKRTSTMMIGTGVTEVTFTNYVQYPQY